MQSSACFSSTSYFCFASYTHTVSAPLYAISTVLWCWCADTDATYNVIDATDAWSYDATDADADTDAYAADADDIDDNDDADASDACDADAPKAADAAYLTESDADADPD